MFVTADSRRDWKRCARRCAALAVAPATFARFTASTLSETGGLGGSGSRRIGLVNGLPPSRPFQAKGAQPIETRYFDRTAVQESAKQRGHFATNCSFSRGKKAPEALRRPEAILNALIGAVCINVSRAFQEKMHPHLAAELAGSRRVRITLFPPRHKARFLETS